MMSERDRIAVDELDRQRVTILHGPWDDSHPSSRIEGGDNGSRKPCDISMLRNCYQIGNR